MVVQLNLTEAEREAFQKDGVVCLRGVLTDTEIAKLRREIDRQMAVREQSQTGYDFEKISAQVWRGESAIDVGAAQRFDVDGLVGLIHADAAAQPLLEEDEASETGCFFYDVAGWRRSKEIRDVGFDSALPQLVGDLMGSETVRFWEDTTFVKSPHTRQKTAYHQDLTYFQIQGEQCVIAWIPLDPAGLDNGVMKYVRGSHLWGQSFAPNMFVSQTVFPGVVDPKCPNIDDEEDAYDIVHFDVEPGDVLIHHVRTLHGAGGNVTDRPRRAISFRYTGDDVRYHDKPGAMPQPDMWERPEEGARLETPDYPMVWPKPWPGISISDLFDSWLEAVPRGTGKRAA